MRKSGPHLGAVLSLCKGKPCNTGTLCHVGTSNSVFRSHVLRLLFFTYNTQPFPLTYSMRFQSSSAGSQPRSRFTRQGSSSRSPTNAGTLLHGPEKYGVNPTGCTSQQFLSLLHRLRAELKQQPSESRRLHTLFVLSHFSLKRIANMDGRVVHQLLELLARLQASPVDTMLVQEAVAWLTLYGSSPSTSAMLVTQCLRNLLHLDSRELIMPVLLGCQSTFAMLESQQRATDACVVLLAAVLHGLTYHDRRSTTSHQQLLPILERLINQVTASSLEHASNTDLRLLLEAFGAASSNAPELFVQRDSEGVSRRLVECLCHLRGVFAQERGEELSGSLLLQEALELIRCCETLFPLSSLGETGGTTPLMWHEEEKKIQAFALRRAIDLLENRVNEESISSAAVLCLQEIILRYNGSGANTSNSAEKSSEMSKLITLGSSCIEKYFSEEGEAAPDVAVGILKLYWDHHKRCNSSSSTNQEESPTDSLSLLVAPPILPPTGCVKLYDDLHSQTGAESKSYTCGNNLFGLPDFITQNIESTWQKCAPYTLKTEAANHPFPWSASSVETLIRFFEHGEQNEKSLTLPRPSQLLQFYFVRLESMYNLAPGRILPSDFAPFFVESASTESCFPDVVKMLCSCMSNWSVNQVLHWLRISAAVPCSASIRSMMREGCKSLIPYMDRASSEQLVALMYYYGRAGVRQDDFCDAVAKRLGKLCEEITGRSHEEVNSSLLSVVGLSIILSSFAAIEYRSTKPFLDSSSVITQALGHYNNNGARDHVETEGPAPFPLSSLLAPQSSIFALSPTSMSETGTILLAAYSKMLVWHFKVIWNLADFLSALSAAMTLRQLVVAQLALQRMDVQHASLTAAFISRLHEWASQTSKNDKQLCSNSDIVILLSVWSRVTSNTAVPIVAVTADRKTSPQESHAVIKDVFETIIRERLISFTPIEHAEILLSLARAGMFLSVSDNGKQSSVFDQITSQLINTLPTATPQALCHMVNAYSIAGRSHPELFSLVAQRVIKAKNDIPAVMIASILSAFSSTGNDDAVLFMEMIPRVRFVAQFGTPRDVTNVVCAYAKVKVWHYKLFSRLADRAIQLRAEFSPVHLVQLLQAYGAVGMRYDSLFTEMSSRIQAVVHLMTPKELGLLLESYAAVHMHCPPVFEACANQGLIIANSFSLKDAELMLSSLEEVGHLHPALWLALYNKFPDQLRDRFLGVQQRQSVNPQHPAPSDVEDETSSS